MRGDRRYARRHRMRRDAWLMLEDGQRCDCVVTDISDKGARINIPDAEAIPEHFMLLFATNGAGRRRCRVIWRKPREVGVKFETSIDIRNRAKTPRKPGAGAASKEAAPAKSVA